MKKIAADSEAPFINLHQDLINGCKKGDQKSQFQIYKLYYKAMYNTSLRIVNNSMEAEDIMQESFLSAFEKIGTYSGTVSFGAWLKTIVHNKSLDYLRKNNNTVFKGIESYQEEAEICQDTPNLNEEPDPRIYKVMELIKLLPKRCRDIFSLYMFEGYDHEEIGEIMSISSSTSRSQFSRAKNMISREFNGR